tara:strand:- start:273 stop:710 length:438 start_codon:yes stop_codon:yes gene_type:complete
MSFPDLIDDGMCFVCGPHNALGLKLRFEERGDEVVTEFTPGVEYQGFQGIVHGGIITTLMDEVMAHVLLKRGIQGLTYKLEVEFKQMGQVGEKLVIRGRLLKERGRILQMEAEACTEAGEVVATAQGKWVRFSARKKREEEDEKA